MLNNYQSLEKKITLFAKKFYFAVDEKLLNEMIAEFHKIVLNFEFIKSFDTENVTPLSFPCDDFFIISFSDKLVKNDLQEPDLETNKKLLNNFSLKNEANYLVIKNDHEGK